jgi:HK97 family phage major capsid protein
MAPTKVTVPQDQAGLEEILKDKDKIKNLFAEPDSFKEFVIEYAQNVHKADVDLSAKIKEETQAVLAEFFKDNGKDPKEARKLNLDPSAPVPSMAEQKRGLYNSKAMGAVLDGECESAGEFFKTIWHQNERTPELVTKLDKFRNAFTSDVPSEGGFLIPERLRAELLRVTLETAVVRPRARVIPMDSLRVPFPAIDSTTTAGSVEVNTSPCTGWLSSASRPYLAIVSATSTSRACGTG